MPLSPVQKRNYNKVYYKKSKEENHGLTPRQLEKEENKEKIEKELNAHRRTIFVGGSDLNEEVYGETSLICGYNEGDIL